MTLLRCSRRRRPGTMPPKRFPGKGEHVPEIIVYCVEGRTPDQKKKLMKGLTDAMVDGFGVAAGSVTVQIVESPKTDKAKGGVPFAEL